MSFSTNRGIQEALPAGIILPFAGQVAPDGWLLCQGQAISRTVYARLYTAIQTSHGSGDGATTFNIPDYRGRFLRGTANGSANDPDRATRTAMNPGGATGDAVGSVQSDDVKPHTHSLSGNLYNNNDAMGNGSVVSVGSTGLLASGTWGGGAQANNNSGNESRPKNASVNYIIKT